MKPYLCPVCNGHGHVPGGFYLSTGPYSTSNVTVETCRACYGTGVLWAQETPVQDLLSPNERRMLAGCKPIKYEDHRLHLNDDPKETKE